MSAMLKPGAKPKPTPKPRSVAGCKAAPLEVLRPDIGMTADSHTQDTAITPEDADGDATTDAVLTMQEDATRDLEDSISMAKETVTKCITRAQNATTHLGKQSDVMQINRSKEEVVLTKAEAEEKKALKLAEKAQMMAAQAAVKNKLEEVKRQQEIADHKTIDKLEKLEQCMTKK